MYDVLIIGAGVSGCACARELSRYDARVLVIDKEDDVCCGTSKANSAIVHAGYDASPGSLMAKLNVEGNALMGALAEELDLPAIVHDRDAHRDTLDIAMEFPNVKGVFHCCAFCVPDALEAIDMGWMLSFTGNVTFQTARRVPEVVAAVPLERIMLETDAPYQTPEPFRGSAIPRCTSTGWRRPLLRSKGSRWRRSPP